MRCGRAVLPSLRGDREEGKQGLERQATGKKEEEEETDSPCIPPSIRLQLRAQQAPPPVEVDGLAVGCAGQGGADPHA